MTQRTGRGRKPGEQIQLPKTYTTAIERYPELMKAYHSLAEEAQQAGPLTERERHLVKLALAVGLGSEGGVHSHTRRATEAGLSADEIRHVALLGVTTIGFPAMMRSLSWMNDHLEGE